MAVLKSVFVLGFYDPVSKVLDSIHADRIRDESVIWIKQKAPGREVNLTEFSAVYSKRVTAGLGDALILAVKPRGRDWVIDGIRTIIENANGDKDLTYELVEFENAGDSDGVLQRIADYRLEPPSGPSCEKILTKVPSGKILCVSMEGTTSVLDALRRSGFSDATLAMFFEEERIGGARNSGLMEHLAARADQFACLLYAFHGLRTLTPEVKGKFRKCYEAPSAAKLAQIALRWMEGD